MVNSHWIFGRGFGDYSAEAFTSFVAGYALHIPGGHRIFDKIFGDYSVEVLAALVAGGGLCLLVYNKPYRDWKIYKKIKGGKAKKSREEEAYPDIKDPAIFPDLPAEEEPRE